MGETFKAPLAAALGALLACLLLAPPAGASYEPVKSGATKLIFAKSFLRALRSEGIALGAKAPAKLQGNTATFAVSAGKFDPTSERGTVEHGGALVFKAGAKSIPLKALQLKTTQRRAPLSAKVGGSQLKIATVKQLAVSRAGFGEKVAVSQLALSAKLATRLAKKLDARDLFKPGMAIGRTVTQANPETIALLGRGKVELNLDPSFAAKLNSLFVAVNPVFPAERPGAFTLAIAGGTIAPDAPTGVIETGGGLEFTQLGGGQVLWQNARLALALKTLAAETKLSPAGEASEPQPLATLALSAISADAQARTVSLAGSLTLDAATATSFNEAFAKPLDKQNVFLADEAFASISLTAQGQ